MRSSRYIVYDVGKVVSETPGMKGGGETRERKLGSGES